MGSMMAGVFIGALLFGYLSDKIGAKKTSLLAMIIGIISIALLLLFIDNVVALVIALIFFGFVTSAIGTIAPAMTSALFGSKDYSRIYSTASMGLAVASIIALPAYGYLFEFTGSYLYALIAIIVMFAANIFFIILSFRDKDKLVQEGHWN